MRHLKFEVESEKWALPVTRYWESSEKAQSQTHLCVASLRVVLREKSAVCHILTFWSAEVVANRLETEEKRCIIDGRNERGRKGGKEGEREGGREEEMEGGWEGGRGWDIWDE